ncbi:MULTISPECIES: hypothetical protein [Bacteroides]|jgi:hypothetical protein|uniref:Uncharacterized protein n=1 Tax=Bacteroides caecimuris TaxID=1796613 RepID=A0A1C7H255_9BACE|nr:MULTISPECIES: hypothetical protein [Bacteroides]ANU57607.1 hypothetical protein A4V03_08525 [Bacteroides caecimuris]OXE60936.1 hypothetical protein ADH74_19985 [Bacteroides caecimuris]QQR17516.1 hypothetical protein I5Q79_00670 [Bacteroides caecimuris]UQA30507.1 hypothetical protein M2854_00720 [Bacteroides caecimuris]
MKIKKIFRTVGISALVVVFSYFVYQDQLAQKELMRSLDRNASSIHPDSDNCSYTSSSPSNEDELLLKTEKKENGSNTYYPEDNFNERLDDFLADPEDEMTFPSEVFDTQIDECDDELIENEIDY